MEIINGTMATAIQQIQVRTHSPATSQPKNLNAGQRRALAMFHDRGTLLQRYSQDAPPVMDEKEAIMGNSPTLAVINSTFGSGTAEVIIASRLSRLNQYTNVKMKITPEQAYDMATRLKYAGIPQEKIKVEPDVKKAIKYVTDNSPSTSVHNQ